MTVDLLRTEMFICEKKVEEFKAHTSYFINNHLKAWSGSAMNKGNTRVMMVIKKTLLRKNIQRLWKQVGHSTKSREGGGEVYYIKVNIDEGKQLHETEDRIFGKGSKDLGVRFWLAFTAPCYLGALFDNVGFIGDTAAVKSILDGTHVYPPGTDSDTFI